QGWNEINKEKYYVENNYMVSGFKEIDGETYFFGLTTNKMLKGWQSVAEGRFYLNSEGKIKQGWNEIDGEKYYVENNYMVSGFKEINGEKYFFGLTTNKLLHGWNNISYNYWYQDENGKMVIGSQNIEGRDYLFDNNGYLQGFKNINGQLYYFNPDGTQAKGVQRMAGLYFKFDSITGAFEKYVNQKIVIDVSSHNGYINWNQVKNAGIVDGVILRLGYSVGFMDTKFLQNVKELNRLRIPYSVYLFSYAVNPYEAGLEADFVIRTIRNNPVHIASNLFSIYYDLESWKIDSTGENSNEISKDAYGGIITTFCDKIKNNLGINARVYASKSYVYDRFPSYAWPYATWIAQWGPTITYKEAFEGWQYTNNGSVPGINGRVDMSIFYY
ncbi:MAG: hypothetical protein HFJ11_06110, partial [Bacilli bacterium]|nr:hypothetical protein [Bacilli bacterium]